MKQLLLVFIGGGFGSALRYLIGKTLNPLFHNFYLGTFTVNILGCLLIGFLLGLSLRGNILTQNQLFLLASGFCGGFTTFSTFAFEKHELLKSGELIAFLLYLFASIIVGLLAVALGILSSKFV